MFLLGLGHVKGINFEHSFLTCVFVQLQIILTMLICAADPDKTALFYMVLLSWLVYRFVHEKHIANNWKGFFSIFSFPKKNLSLSLLTQIVRPCHWHMVIKRLMWSDADNLESPSTIRIQSLWVYHHTRCYIYHNRS